MDFTKYEYIVKVEGREFRAECSYGGLRECQYITTIFGKPDKEYKIRMVKKEIKQDETI